MSETSAWKNEPLDMNLLGVLLFLFFGKKSPRFFKTSAWTPFFVLLEMPQVFQYFCLTDAHPQELLFVVTPLGRSSRALLSFENINNLSPDDLCSSFLFPFEIILKQCLGSFFIDSCRCQGGRGRPKSLTLPVSAP